MIGRFIALLASACVAGVACASAALAATEIKLATFGPPNSFFYVEVILPWAAKVSQASGGTIEIKHYGNSVLGNAGTMFDSVMSGAADIGWALPHTAPGKFVKSSIIELPFGYEKGEVGAVAYWRLYAKGLIASDFEGVKLFGLTAWPAAAIQTKSAEVHKLEDLKGLKLRVAGKLQADTVLALGATPVQVPVDQIFQSIDKGVIDGAWASATAVLAFRLHEVTKRFLDIPLNGAGGMIIMSRKNFDKLPDKAKAAFDAQNGEEVSRLLGKSNDGEVVRVMNTLNNLGKAGKGNKVYHLSQAEEERWTKATEPVVAAWVKRTPNGAAILRAFREEVAAVRKGM